MPSQSSPAGARWNMPRIVGVATTAIAVAMGLFHLYTAGFGMLEPMKQRNLHLTFALVLAFLIFPPPHRKGQGTNWWDVALALLALLPWAWLWFDYDRILNRIEFVDPITMIDHATSILLIVLTCEAVRRTVGGAMLTVILAVAAYAFLGPFIPGFLGHRGLSWDAFIDMQVMTMGGIYTVPIAVSATYVVIFVLFGAFLVRTGMGAAMIDVARAMAGHTRGGPAKIAVISSGFFGSINGSSVANVVATGSFTIPLMKGVGYRPHFAGAVEAVASTGGQFTPPVMGAAVFIMVEMTGIPYVSIISAAVIPALLFYGALLFAVHFEAARLNLPVLPRMPGREVTRALVRLVPFTIPVGVLLYCLIQGFSPILGGFWATMTLIVVAMARKETRLDLKGFIEAFEIGARGAVVIAVTCAGAGILIGVVNALGIGIKFASAIFTVSDGVQLVALIMVMVAGVLLGMGLPTSAAYVIVASVAAPPLVEMGIPALSAHLFVIFFACLSSITPPVAIAAYAGAAIAGADPNRTGFAAWRLGLAGFLIPFLFIYWPALLLQGEWHDILLAVITAGMGITALAASTIGWYYRRLRLVERAIFFIIALLLMTPGIYTDTVGLALLIGASLYLRREREERQTAVMDLDVKAPQAIEMAEGRDV